MTMGVYDSFHFTQGLSYSEWINPRLDFPALLGQKNRIADHCKVQ